MKQLFKRTLLLLGFLPFICMAQAVEKNTLVVVVRYFNNNNNTQHLTFKTKSKIDGKFKNMSGITLNVFINSEKDQSNLIGKVTTNDVGDGLLLIPPSARAEWLKSPNQSFIAISEVTSLFDEARGETSITKAKIKIDTLDGRNISASLIALVDSVWTPIQDVEMLVGIKRLDGNLNVNETPTYTTDSLGNIMAEFKRDSLPGDNKGNLILVASVIDNDVYGNLSTEMEVPWGAPFMYSTNYDHRSLFARRGHAPIWLTLLAYGIVVAVWAVIIFLMFQIRQLKKIS